ncbi:hypothetical protein ABZ532_10890 [Streptomyces sp. NPDC019396]|uniref:hypothetical protein n=1 Tax=Streptomyces sp. NPDC019396 TaxID=3154687 RepID=UPI0033FD7965
MATYYEIMRTDLSKLTTAASDWDSMADGFHKLAESYKKEVRGISMGDSWVGLSAQAGSARFAVTLKEYQGAESEAKAVAQLIRDAHAEFGRLRKKIEDTRDDAVKAGMRVSERGVVHFDTSKLDRGEHVAYVHDPEYQESARKAAAGWGEQIDMAVRAVNDADEGFKVALATLTRDSDVSDGTIGGFNREAKPSPYPSLEEAGKAQRIPKDRRAVAEWWRDLDPVTRAVLLHERGDELREAGIMSPLYKWHSPDAGSGAYDTEDPTGEDLWFLARAQAIAAGGDFTGENAASRNMEHYLGKTGDPLDLDVDRILKDDSGFRDDVSTHIAQNQDAWRRQGLDAFEKAGGHTTVVVPVESHAEGRTFKSDEWFHAVGSHQQNVSGMVTVSPGEDGRPKVSLDYQANVWDRYNWDEGKSTTFPGGVEIPDSEMGRLHKVGFAQEFDMRGSSSTYSYDLGSGADAAVNPPDQGREGTRADVSRGDEENR